MKEYAWYALTDKWILAQKHGLTKTHFTYQMMAKKEEKQDMDTLILHRGWITIPTGDIETKGEADSEGLTPPIDPSYIQLQNQNSIIDAR